MNHVLIVYENIPETSEFFLIPASELSKQDLGFLRQCVGKYINSTDMSPTTMAVCNRVAGWLAPPKYSSSFEDCPSYERSRYFKFKVEAEDLAGATDKHIASVIVTGFLM